MHQFHHARRHLRLFFACCAVSGALLAPRPAEASGVAPSDATPAQKKSAMDHFSSGKRALESKNWDKAVTELRASLEVVDSPNARLELARGLRDSGKLDEAWSEYGRVIEGATRLAAKEDRYAKTADVATTERGEIEGKLALVVATVQHAPPGATLSVGGRTIPPDQWSAPIIVQPGSVEVVFSDGGGKELAHKTINVPLGEKAPVALDAAPAPAATAAAASPPKATSAQPLNAIDDSKPSPDARVEPVAETPPPTTSGKSKLRPYAYVATGVGVVGLGMFAAFGILSNSTYSDLQSACPKGCPPSKQDEINSGTTQQTIANVSLAVGVIGAVVAVTLFAVSVPSKTSSAGSASLVLSPGYVGLRGSL